MAYARYIIFLVLIGLLFTNITVHAQNAQDILHDVQNDIRLQALPQYPQAGETVALSLVSYTTDLNRATITWRINGIVVLQGIGEKNYDVTMGTLGSKTLITTTIKTAQGLILERQLSLNPTDIDIIWQATSYTPPLYDGKALFPHQGLITFYAIPSSGSNTTLTNAGNYVFKWRKDGEALGNYSGYGLNTFTLRGTVISKAFTIQVEVTDLTGTVLGTGSVTVTPQSPELAFYEDSPLYGPIYNRALTNITLPNKEVTILASHYFFNNSPEPTDFQYDWSMNNRIIPQQEAPNKLTLRAEGDKAGTAIISLQLQNIAKILQFANSSLTVNFRGN